MVLSDTEGPMYAGYLQDERRLDLSVNFKADETAPAAMYKRDVRHL